MPCVSSEPKLDYEELSNKSDLAFERDFIPPCSNSLADGQQSRPQTPSAIPEKSHQVRLIQTNKDSTHNPLGWPVSERETESNKAEQLTDTIIKPDILGQQKGEATLVSKSSSFRELRQNEKTAVIIPIEPNYQPWSEYVERLFRKCVSQPRCRTSRRYPISSVESFTTRRQILILGRLLQGGTFPWQAFQRGLLIID
jgi:hypothetical protein